MKCLFYQIATKGDKNMIIGYAFATLTSYPLPSRERKLEGMCKYMGIFL